MELMQQVIQTPVQQHYVRKLLGFDFSIEYKTDPSNKAADALSRIYEEEAVVESAFLALSKPIPTLLDDLRRECASKPELLSIKKQVEAGILMPHYLVRDSLLFYKNRYCVASDSDLKKLILHEFHATPNAGHCGVKRMLVRLTALFYWKNLRKDVEAYISRCLVCQQTKYSTQPPAGLLQPLPTPNDV